MTALTAIIGGTGLTTLDQFAIEERECLSTPYGDPSADLIFGRLFGQGKREREQRAGNVRAERDRKRVGPAGIEPTTSTV